METIPVLVEPTATPSAGTLGVLSPSLCLENVNTARLRQSLAQLSEQISGLLQDIKNVGSFQLKEVQLQVAITAEGGVALVGLAKAGITGTIALKFTL
ncbi:MAG: hypothetical protein AB7N91_13840 [Candidatus Tectimicrobiota bacterium]